MSAPKKRKKQTFYIDVNLPDKLQRLQLKRNNLRTAAQGVLSLGDLVEEAVEDLLRKEEIK